MKLKKAEIHNYKSLTDVDNTLFVDNINAIVGKNESGKSNLVEALSNIGIISQTDEKLFQFKNINSNKDISIKLWFENYSREKDIIGETIVEITSPEECTVTGAMSEYIKNDVTFKLLYNKLIELSEYVVFSQSMNKERKEIMMEKISQAENNILVLPDFYDEFLNLCLKSQNEDIKNFGDIFKKIIFHLDAIYCNFPFFVRIENSELKSKYTTSQLDDEMLEKFLEVNEIEVEELLQIMSSSDATEIRNFERKANEKIKENFTKEFNQFYSQEDVTIEIAVNSNELNILVDTSNKYLSYDERSNGMKWYLNIFVQLLFMERKNCRTPHNNIILIDEPGVYLHANAQKELYSLLKKITENENQIIYTTHSPFMLNSNELQNIRAIIKDDEGNSHIYNKLTTIPAKDNSTYDTITPLLFALGMNIDHNLGPNISKKNIIVEGMSDYLYLQSYFYVKNITDENKPNIIPSTGADNIFSIASILYGWGCDFMILVDQDEKGREKYDSLKDRNHPFLENFMFVDGTTDKQEIDFEIENLFCEDDKETFGINKRDYSSKKYNYAYSTYTAIIQNEKSFSEETMRNFDNLNLTD